MNSCLKWIGGKGGSKTKIYLERIPKHSIFISEFCGACHVELAKPVVSFEMVNDKNDELVNFMMILRDRAEELYQKCSGLPYSESLFKKYKFEEMPEDDLERAVRFFYLVRCGFSGGGNKYKTGFSVSSQRGSKAREYRKAAEAILYMADRIKNWHIMNRDFEEIARKYDGRWAFHFMDPPYYECEDLYKGGFQLSDHERLRNTAEDLQGKVMICYYDHPEIRKLYKGWHIESYETKSRARARETGDVLEKETELIIMNYRPESVQMKLW